ncbi:MAG: hypothetical protein QM652_01170 [Legionella sp.]|uniref:hypothetical protein n=1 Tax=Legionella sp. TaxID=459 RepID=UPI0039E7071D
MKKLIITSSALAISLSLVGCNTMSNTANYTTSTVGHGVKYGARTVGTGVGVVGNTGTAVGRGVGSVFGSTVGWIGGKPANYRYTNTYRKNDIIYHNGHQYVVKNGRYVRIH